MVISANNVNLEYSGRIDYENDKAIFVFPCTYVKIRFKGKNIWAYVDNKNNYWDNYVGVIIDGNQEKILLENDSALKQRLELAEGLDETKEHEVMLFKRQDSCHELGFYGFELDDAAVILEINEKPSLKLEVYGDSVSAGEVSEAIDFVGKPDPEWHKGELSNSYYSYSWILARKLNAKLHDIAQGGIALLDNTGWFNAPDFIGMESVYDKVRYNPAFGRTTYWDFDKYTPDIVIVAIGQNDNHPEDYMAEFYHSKKSENWREHYRKFVMKLMEIYPKAQIILCTTILEHHKNWDDSIEEVCKSLENERVHHFYFSNNGKGTPGHIRKPEAEKMADELAAYINGLI